MIYTALIPGFHMESMTEAARTLSFTRKASLFQAGLHTDASLEKLVEGTRQAVLAWVAALAPELAGPAAHCLDLLALLPPELVQRLSLAAKPTAAPAAC